jgi:Alpha amylase, catalytic domain
MTEPKPWWARAVFHQVYPRSFADSNGDGVGDLDGVVAHLDYLETLGVDAIWLNPVNVSPMADHGYDVADPRDVDPLFGGMAALERLVEAAHRRNIRVTMDLVPNHTSSQHSWFQAALAAAPGSAERERYIFRDGTGRGGAQPPNNWVSVFGGPAWTRITEPDGTPGQWYLHLFDAEQPDLNWDNPEVFDDLEKTLRFWLDRGIDGFRIDVAHGMAKPPGLPDMKNPNIEMLKLDDDDPRFNHESVHDIHRGIRLVLNDYPHAVAIGEVWVFDNEQFARYLRADELHLGFNFRLLRAKFDAVQPRRRPGGHPLRRWLGRLGPRTGDGVGDARAAWGGVHLQRRGAGPSQCRAARRGVAGPGVGALGAYRARPRRLPRASAVGGRRFPVWLFVESSYMAANPAAVGGADGAAAAGTARLDVVVLSESVAAAANPARVRRRGCEMAVRRCGVPSARRRADVRAEPRRKADAAARGRAVAHQRSGRRWHAATEYGRLAGVSRALAQ